MDILMLRFDIFEELHKDLYDFWSDILRALMNSDISLFAATITYEDKISQRITPEVYALCESRFNHLGTQMDLEEAQQEIKGKLKIPKVLILMKARISREARDTDVIDAEDRKLLQEYYEIEESKKHILHDIEKLESIIQKEMKIFWNHIDTLIIYSYKQMLFDVTGSDDIVNAFMNESRTVGLSKNLSIAKRKHDYEAVLNMINWLNESTEGFLYIIERMIIGEQE